MPINLSQLLWLQWLDKIWNIITNMFLFSSFFKMFFSFT